MAKEGIAVPFTLIKGRFFVKGYSPDGDSIRFAPLNPALLRRLSGPPARINARGHVQLRIEAIDALETHYVSSNGVYHQPDTWARAAIDRLMDFTGIRNVRWDHSGRTVLSADDGTPGFILARAVEKNGRPVAFVFAGQAIEQDGASIVLNADRLRHSYNFTALAEGLAYPTYYQSLFGDLRQVMSQAVHQARAERLGFWPEDRTAEGFTADNLSVIVNDIIIMPKLFRRLVEYMVSVGTAVGFKEKLARSREPVLDLTTQNFTHFDTFVEQEPGSERIRLSRNPEDLVFDPMPQRPSDAFALMLSNLTPPLPVEAEEVPNDVL